MAKRAYIGINNVAKKIKKIYVGIGGVAKKVKKAYVGIGGVAKLFFSVGYTLVKVSPSPSTLSRGKIQMAGVSTENHALFAGGNYLSGNASYKTNEVESYNTALTKTIITSLATGKSNPPRCTLNNYALIIGGSGTGDITAASKRIECYDDNLVYSNLGNTVYGLETYGYYGYTSDHFISVSPTGMNIINSEFTISSDVDTYPSYCYKKIPIFNGSNLLIGGGYNSNTSSALNDVICYDSYLTKSSASNFSTARYEIGGATVAKKFLFGGGSNTSSGYALNSIEVYDENLTHSTISLGTGMACVNGNSIGEYALFAGGSSMINSSISTSYYSYVYQFDENLTRSSLMSLSNNCSIKTSTIVGNSILFAGGYRHNYSTWVTTYYTTVDAYKLQEI